MQIFGMINGIIQAGLTSSYVLHVQRFLSPGKCCQRGRHLQKQVTDSWKQLRDGNIKCRYRQMNKWFIKLDARIEVYENVWSTKNSKLSILLERHTSEIINATLLAGLCALWYLFEEHWALYENTFTVSLDCYMLCCCKQL